MVDTEDIFRRLTSGARFDRERLRTELAFLRVSLKRGGFILFNAHRACREGAKVGRRRQKTSQWQLLWTSLVTWQHLQLLVSKRERLP